MKELGENVKEIVAITRHGSNHFRVDYTTEATDKFIFSLIVVADDEVGAFSRFNETLEYWNNNATLKD